MANVTVRNLDDAVHDRLKRAARANHRSLEAEIRCRLEQDESGQPPNENLADYFRRTMIDPGPNYEGSVALIRSIRDEE